LETIGTYWPCWPLLAPMVCRCIALTLAFPFGLRHRHHHHHHAAKPSFRPPSWANWHVIIYRNFKSINENTLAKDPARTVPQATYPTLPSQPPLPNPCKVESDDSEDGQSISYYRNSFNNIIVTFLTPPQATYPTLPSQPPLPYPYKVESDDPVCSCTLKLRQLVLSR
jgi:hypothetical protein